MEIASLYDSLEYGKDKPSAKVLFNTEDVKEIRIVFRKGQEMKEHKAGYPIVVQIVEGSIDFGVNKERFVLEKGKLITLESDIPHDLLALEDSIVRLSLNKSDDVNRPKQVVEQ